MDSGLDDATCASVDILLDSAARSHFYIDNASFSGILHSVGIASLLFVLSFYAALRSPPLFNTPRRFFNVKRLSVNSLIEAHVVISELRPIHRFIAVNCSFVARSAGRTFILPINITVRYLTNQTHEPRTLPTVSRGITFLSCCRLSQAFEVIHMPIVDFDTLDLRLLLEGDFQTIDGFDMQWKFANVNVEKYQKSIHYLLSFVMAYMLVIFAMHFGAQLSFMEWVIVILGITGVMSSNPFGLFSFPSGSLVDDVLGSVFVSTYRLFLVLELETLRSGRNNPHWILVIVCILFFLVDTQLTATTSNARRTHIRKPESEVAVIIEGERLLIRVHIIYLLVSFMYLLVAAAMNNGQNVRRVRFATISWILTSAATGFTQVVFVWARLWMYSIVPELLFRAVHIVMAGMTLFLFHSVGDREYNTIGLTEASISLEPEQATDTHETDGIYIVASVNVEEDIETE
jgi:hypothetical protein